MQIYANQNSKDIIAVIMYFNIYVNKVRENILQNQFVLCILYEFDYLYLCYVF